MRQLVQRKAAERIPAPMLDAAGRAVLRAVDEAVERRWDRALRRADEASGRTVEARTRSVARSFRRELVSLGAATGASAAAPGIGTASALSLLAAEMSWFAFRATDLIMTIGAIHGHRDASAEERRAWVLSVLAFGDAAADGFAGLVADLDRSTVVGGEKVGTLLAGVAGGDAAALETLRKLNTALASRVLTRYGSRRGVLTIGRLLPFGVGAVVGGTANWALIRATVDQATGFFEEHQVRLSPPPPPPSLPPPPTGRSGDRSVRD